MVVENPLSDAQRGYPATEEGGQHLADGRRRQRRGSFSKAMVAGLLLIAVATLVNFLLLSWSHPTGESTEVVVASLLTSALLIVAVSITTAVVIRSMSEEDNRIGDRDARITNLQANVKDLTRSLERLDEKVQRTAPPGLPKKVEDLEAKSTDVAEKVRVLCENVRKVGSSRGQEAPGG